MPRRLALLALTTTVLVGVVALGGRQVSAQSYEPTRIRKAVELLDTDQPIYYTQVNAGADDEGTSHDYTEATTAWSEKRTPKFKGR